MISKYSRYLYFSKFIRSLNKVFKPKLNFDIPLGLSTGKFVRFLSNSGHCIEQQIDGNFLVGSEISGFHVRQVKNIPELQLTAIRLEHIGTGADYLHIARNDPNNVFCIGFRTTPMNSSGVPHILEHTVLCGSDKYPCSDPFFKMINRSLSTFMNAMTGSDYTIYPFSTQHPVDFRNLMGVYLDSVFKPHLTELDFLQEGWRIEHENPEDQSSPLTFKGVVFNEMKGVFADPQNLFLQKLQNGLLPSHTYGYVSGGDPLMIPELTWKDLRDFHANHYHPSNSRIFSYGNQPLLEHLKFINEYYLSKFTKIIPNTSVPDEPRWKEPKRTHIHCGIDAMGQKNHQSSLAVSYLLTDIKDINENFTLAIIGELLMSGPNSPFYKSLIESELGNNFAPGSGFDGHTRATSFTVGLQGVEDSQFEVIVNSIEKTFDQTIAGGFPQERIDAVLHNIELGVKHQSTSFGLNLAMNLAPLWNQEGDPIDALKINNKINSFKKSLKEDPLYLQNKIKQYFRNNEHKFILSMSPEKDYETKQIQAEKKILENKINGLTITDKEHIFALGKLLKSKQERKEDVSCLPTLNISDISRNIPLTAIKKLKLEDNVPLQLCEQPTNGVTYFKLVLDIQNLPAHLQSLLPLFCGILTEMGAGDLDFRTLSQKIDLVSGGLSANIHITEHPQNLSSYEQSIVLSSHCLQSNLEPMLELWSKILNEIKLDDKSRFNTLVKMIANDKANSLVHSGHNYAMLYSASSVSYVSQLKEQWSGLTYLQMLKQLSELPDLTDTLDKLQEIASILLHNSKLRIAINTLPEFSEEAINKVGQFLNSLKCSGSSDFMSAVPSSFTPHTQQTHHVFPFPVNFTAKSFSYLPFAHPDTGSMRVLARLMFQFLHREIREKGGAYGGGAVSHPGGPFSFYSYRDPHSSKTLKTFDEAVEWVLSGDFTPQDVDEAKLGVFQKVDSPVAPGSKGLRLFLQHISDEMFNEHRASILDTDSHDLINVCRTYLREAKIEGSCLIGPQNESLEKDPFWVTCSHG